MVLLATKPVLPPPRFRSVVDWDERRWSRWERTVYSAATGNMPLALVGMVKLAVYGSVLSLPGEDSRIAFGSAGGRAITHQ